MANLQTLLSLYTQKTPRTQLPMIWRTQRGTKNVFALLWRWSRLGQLTHGHAAAHSRNNIIRMLVHMHHIHTP
jgi:hypothetical protein